MRWYEVENRKAKEAKSRQLEKQANSWLGTYRKTNYQKGLKRKLKYLAASKKNAELCRKQEEQALLDESIFQNQFEREIHEMRYWEPKK